jgi:mannitol-1-phosphate 5-dehydrogenase
VISPTIYIDTIRSTTSSQAVCTREQYRLLIVHVRISIMTGGKQGGIFTGFGFGAIQAGLFTLEALREKAFEEVVICEISAELVSRLRENKGYFTVNIARSEGVEAIEAGPIEILNPCAEADREILIDKLSRSREAATAVPSVEAYSSSGPSSIHRLLASASRGEKKDPLVVYTAENNNQAAEILRDAVRSESGLPGEDLDRNISFVNTVIGKMSGIITDPGEIEARQLSRLVPGYETALLVEEFNRILVSAPPGLAQRGWRPSFSTFETRDDLLPFEEAKLYGHNGVHAMGAYLAAHLGIARMDELRTVPGAVDFLHEALVKEAGAALLARYGGIDELFTAAGYAGYAEELIGRMLNPHLGDLVARVARDPGRKLAWNDRLVGTLRLGLETGVSMPRFALAAAAALLFLEPALNTEPAAPQSILEPLWAADQPPAQEAAEICSLVQAGLDKLRRNPPEALFA